MNFTHHIKQTLLLSLPLVGSQLAQIAINTTDTIMLGWDGTLSLASGVLGTQAIFFFFILGTGFGQAVVPLASRAFAKDDKKGVRRSVRMGLWIVSILMLIAMPILWFFEDIFLVLGQDPEAARYATEYIRVAQWSLFAAMWGLVFRNFFATIGRAQIVFWAIIPGIFLNILLNYALIFGNFGAPQLGVVGAAWASLFTNILIMLILFVWYFIHAEYNEYTLLTRFWRSDWSVFWRVGQLGLPISISILAEVSMFIGAAVLIGWIGTTELAAHGIALQVTAVAFMIPLGISGAATIRVSNAYGRESIDDIMLAAKAATYVAFGFAILTAATIALFPYQLAGLFLDEAGPDTATVIMIAVPMLLVAAGFQLVDSAQVIAAGILRGFQDATVPMIISVICYGPMGLLMAYLCAFTFGFGPTGVWFGLTIGLALTSVFLGMRYFLVIGRVKRSLEKSIADNTSN
jgi:MATE family multidrug resistance protein